MDSDCAVYAMLGQFPALADHLTECEPGDVAISAISYAEIALGTFNDKPPPTDVLDAFLEAIPLLAFDAQAAQTYAGLPFKRARFDRLIAAHALSLDAILVTNNEQDFADVPGLKIENWTLSA